MKSTKAETENRITEVYMLLMKQKTFANICQYASKEWGVTSRQTARYVEKARKLISQEAALARRNAFEVHLAIRRHLYSQAYDENNWRCCLDILKDEAQILNLYPPKITELDAIKTLVDSDFLPAELLEKIRAALAEFQEAASAAFQIQNPSATNMN